MTSGGLAAVSSSFFAALYSAFGKYDVVHIHAEGPAFFAWLPKMFGKRVVVTVHGIDWKREKWQSGLGSKFIHQGEKNTVKYADEVIVLSKGVQDYFKETYGRETHFIPNGVNRPQIREASLITDKFGLKKDSYILFLGRLVPEKGIRYLIEAFKNVKTDKKLVIAGGSSDTDSFMEELKELAKGDDRILFTGFVQGAMLDELYSYAIIGIALMHVLANGEYGIGGFVFERLIPSFTNLVFLFMMVSGFGMCCGYYQKIVDQILTREDFLNYNELYSKRIEEYDRKITELEAERQNLQTAPNTYPFLDVYRKYRKLEEITRPMVVELIEKIEVYEGNRVEITFQFQDEIADLLEELHQKQMGQHEVSA